MRRQQDQRSVLLTPNLKIPTNKHHMPQESNESFSNVQSKKVEAYKAKWKASIEEKQQLQADHQRLLRRLNELEKRNKAAKQKNKQSEYSENKQVKGITSASFSKRFELEQLRNDCSPLTSTVSSKRHSIGVLQSRENSVSESFLASYSPATGYRDSLKPFELLELPKCRIRCDDEKRWHVDTKFSPTASDNNVNRVQKLRNDSSNDISGTVEATRFIKEELKMLISRKQKLEEEVFQLKAELSKEQERRWMITDEYIQVQKKLSAAMDNWKLFYEHLLHNFLPEYRKLLAYLKRSQVGDEYLQRVECEPSRTNCMILKPKNQSEEANVQGKLSHRSFFSTKNSANVSFVNNIYTTDSASSFQTSGEQVSCFFPENESDFLLVDEGSSCSGEWSSLFNGFICNQPIMKVACSKVLTSLKQLDCIESKIENMTNKLEDRITQLSAKVVLLRSSLVQISKTRLKFLGNPKAITSILSENNFNLHMDSLEAHYGHNVSQTNDATSEEAAFTTKSLGNCNFDSLQEKVEELESKYGSLVARKLVEYNLSLSLDINLNELNNARSLRFLNLIDILLRHLDLFSNKEGNVISQSEQTPQVNCSTNEAVLSSQNGVLQDAWDITLNSEVEYRQRLCIHCKLLYQENKSLKGRVAELEEENSYLADRIF